MITDSSCGGGGEKEGKGGRAGRGRLATASVAKSSESRRRLDELMTM